MRTIEQQKRNVRHAKKRVAGLRRYGKPEQRALRDYLRADTAAKKSENAAP